MNIDKRREAIATFRGDKDVKKAKGSKRGNGDTSEKNIKILVATLRTAGVGLNLAFASRVISM